MNRHHWDEEDRCLSCGLVREFVYFKIGFAANNNSDKINKGYTHKTGYLYVRGNVKTGTRPNCLGKELIL